MEKSNEVKTFKTTFVVLYSLVTEPTFEQIVQSRGQCINKLKFIFDLPVICSFDIINWSLLSSIYLRTSEYFAIHTRLKNNFKKLLLTIKEKKGSTLKNKVFISSYPLQLIRRDLLPNALKYEVIDTEDFLFLVNILDQVITEKIDDYIFKRRPAQACAYRKEGDPFYKCPFDQIFPCDSVYRKNLYIHGQISEAKQKEVIIDLKPETDLFFIPMMQFGDNITND